MKKENDVRNDKRNGVQFKYILDCIDDSSQTNDENIVFSNDEEGDKARIKQVVEAFKFWDCDFERRRTPNRAERIGSWLRGLPSAIAIDFEDYRIIEIGKSWGYCQTKKKEAMFVENWFSFLGLRIVQLALHFGIDW